MKLHDKIVRGIMWSATQTWGGRLISIVVFIVLARMIEPKAFGLVALAMVFTGIVNIFLDGGFSEAIIQRDNLERAHLDTAFWIAITVGLLSTGLAWWSASYIAVWFAEPALAPILRWLSCGFIIGSLSITQQAILQRELALKRLAIVTMGATMAGAIAAVTAAFMGMGVWSLVIQTLTTRGAMACLLWRVGEWRPGVRFSLNHGRELFTYGVNVAGAHLLLIADRHALDLIIGSVMGPVALGYFTLANRIVRELTRALVTTGKAVAFPVLSRMQNDPDQMRNGLYTANQWSSLIVFPVFTGLAMTAPLIVPVCCGAKWNESIPLLQVLAFVGLLRAANVCGSWLKAAGRPGLNFWLMFLQASGSVIGTLFAVNQGLVAISLAYLFVNMLLWPLWVYTVHCIVRLDWNSYLRPYAGPFASALGMAIALTCLKQIMPATWPLASQLAVSIATGVASYTLCVRVVAPSMASEVIAAVQPILVKPQI